MMLQTRAGLVMVTSWSWMANVRTSFFIVRILRIRNGLMSRSVGSNSIVPLFFSTNKSGILFANMCQGVFCPWYGVGGDRWFWGFLVSPWCFVHPGGTGFAGPLPCENKAWVSKMCLLLDTPFGRRSVAALSGLLLGSLLGSTKHCQSDWREVLWFCWYQAVHAGFSGTAQCPSLLCMYSFLG